MRVVLSLLNSLLSPTFEKENVTLSNETDTATEATFAILCTFGDSPNHLPQALPPNQNPLNSVLNMMIMTAIVTVNVSTEVTIDIGRIKVTIIRQVVVIDIARVATVRIPGTTQGAEETEIDTAAESAAMMAMTTTVEIATGTDRVVVVTTTGHIARLGIDGNIDSTFSTRTMISCLMHGNLGPVHMKAALPTKYILDGT